MSTSFLLILVLALAIVALLAAWAGIRSIQSARSVVFYRTRQARMTTGRQWLGVSLALAVLAGAVLAFGNSIVSQILSPASTPAASSTAAPTFPPASSQTNPAAVIQTATEAGPDTRMTDSPFTATIPVTPSRTPPYLGTYTALAIWTERRSTFIAMLSFTPTASHTPIPTWTRTPSSTPRPTYTASATRTARPTWTASPTRTPITPRPTWTPSPTRTPRPMPTPTSTATRTATAAP